MLIISLARGEITGNGDTLWLILVTFFNYETGEGVVVPMAFDTPEDRDDSFEMLEKIAKLQGGEQYNPDEPHNPFSDN